MKASFSEDGKTWEEAGRVESVTIRYGRHELTKKEQKEILRYLGWRFSDLPEPDWDAMPRWLVELESCRRKCASIDWTMILN